MSTKSDLAVNFKSATLYLVRLVLYSHDTDELLSGINAHLEKSGDFFENEPVVLDAQGLEKSPEWKKIVACLKLHSIPVIGFTAQEALIKTGRKAGLVPLNLAPTHTRSTTNSTAAVDVIVEAQPTTNNTTSPALVIDRPLRSGQKIYARNSDLIVMGLVSQGAEVIADGNIHVYGPLRGKAMAGATGDNRAKIFTTQFNAELVSIAGTYRALNPVPPSVQDKPTQVFLEGEKLIVDNLAI